MKKFSLLFIAGFVCCLIVHHSYGQDTNAGFSLEAIGSLAIPLTTNKMTNIVFPTAIKPGIKVSRDILAEKPRGTTNVLVLKAARAAFAPTNLSVYGEDGRLYSFDLSYAEDPPVLNFKVNGDGVSEKMPLEKDAEAIGTQTAFLHRETRNGKTQLLLRGIYLQDGVMWFCLTLRNHSAIAYSPETIRWLVRNGRRLKRTAVQEIVLKPEYEIRNYLTPGDSSRPIIAGFRPFTLARNKQLVVEVGEKDGGRNLSLIIKPSELLKIKLIQHAIK